jgi:hypothetical protein
MPLSIEGEWPSPLLSFGLVLLAIGAFGPGLAAACFAVAALATWRTPRTSSRLARFAWVFWVVAPLPILLLPLSYLFSLNSSDAARTSASQVRHLLTVTAPALFGLLPGTLRAALVFKRFLPESRTPGEIAALTAPACFVAYLIPLGILAQLAFEMRLYFGLLLLALSSLVPFAAVPRLLRPDTPDGATRVVRGVGIVQVLFNVVGAALIVLSLGEHPLLRRWLGHVDPLWTFGLVSRALAGKWLMTVVVTDLLVSKLHKAAEAVRSLAGASARETLAQKLDALGTLLTESRPSG